MQCPPHAVVEKVCVKRITPVKKSACLEATEFDRLLALPVVLDNGETDRVLMQDQSLAAIAVSGGMGCNVPYGWCCIAEKKIARNAEQGKLEGRVVPPPRKCRWFWNHSICGTPTG